MAKYHAYFTSGALLYEESVTVIEKVESIGQRGHQVEVSDDWISANSMKARKTMAREISRRLNAVSSSVWEGFLKLQPDDQKLILYYACCKAYTLLFDFHLQVLLDKWLTSILHVTRIDFDNFLVGQSYSHPEIEGWSENTRKKLAQVSLRILSQAGILTEESKLQKPFASAETWNKIYLTGDHWFLEFMFLSQAEKKRIVNI